MSDEIISTLDLTKVYAQKKALDSVNLTVHQGDILGLVGKNGAGKTTLIRILSGIVKPTSGSFKLFNDGDRNHLSSLLGNVSCMIEHPALYEELTGAENLVTACILKDIASPIQSGYVRKKMDFVGLGDLVDSKKKVKNYSLGMKQRLGIAMATIGEPKLMMLDEPTNGLDPSGIAEIRQLLVSLNQKNGATILISSHILPELEKFATSYVFIDQGKLLASKSASELESTSGKSLIIKTNDNQTAFNLLKEKGFKAVLVDDKIRVEDITQTSDVLNLLYANQLTLNFMKEEENSLEEYYLGLTGGNKQ
jgi:ABC-2 type transport system ATP-binding protein